jgi:hypothetical protein
MKKSRKRHEAPCRLRRIFLMNKLLNRKRNRETETEDMHSTSMAAEWKVLLNVWCKGRTKSSGALARSKLNRWYYWSYSYKLLVLVPIALALSKTVCTRAYTCIINCTCTCIINCTWTCSCTRTCNWTCTYNFTNGTCNGTCICTCNSTCANKFSSTCNL